MLLDPADRYHVGIVVDDFEAARDLLSETCGYEWGPELRLEYAMRTPTGSVTYEQRLQYSVTEPRLELVQAAAGTPLQPSTSGLHHLGYWCDDVAGTSAELVARGWTWECGGGEEDAPVWAYHRNPAGVRIELVSSALREVMQGLWTSPAPI